MKHILCMGRTRSVPGPCKGYLSYMYVHNILYDRRLSDIILYHPMLSLRSDPILLSKGDSILFPTSDPILSALGNPLHSFQGNP